MSDSYRSTSLIRSEPRYTKPEPSTDEKSHKEHVADLRRELGNGFELIDQMHGNGEVDSELKSVAEILGHVMMSSGLSGEDSAGHAFAAVMLVHRVIIEQDQQVETGAN